VRYDDFDAKALTVKLPSNYDNKKIRVLIYPTGISFEAALLDFSEGVAKVDLTGEIDQGDSWAIGELEQEFNRLEIQQAQKVVLVASSLTSISDEALRYLTYYIRRRTRETGGSFTLSVEGANDQVKRAFLNANVVEPDQIS
jgi:methyl-accepting chemotaxis protein